MRAGVSVERDNGFKTKINIRDADTATVLTKGTVVVLELSVQSTGRKVNVVLTAREVDDIVVALNYFKEVNK